MSKRKAKVYTAILVIAMTVVLTASFFVKNEYGISLYQLIMGAIGSMWIGSSVTKFYEWLRKE